QHRRIDRLEIKISGAEAYSLNRQIARVRLHHGDQFRIRREREDLPQNIQRLRGRAGLAARAQIEQHDLGNEAAYERGYLFATLPGRQRELGKDAFELTAQIAVASEDQQLMAGVGFAHQRAPLPMNTTSAVCSRMATSNRKLLCLM